MTTTLYRPPDVDEAWEQWKASCGPCALAALLGRPLADVRSLFPGIEQRNFCNPTHVEAALNAAQTRWRKDSGATVLPVRGLAFLQVTGPWDAPGVPVAAAYRATHWIGVETAGGHQWVYDINADDWLPQSQWETEIMPLIVSARKRATGWRLRCTYELAK